MLKFNTKDTNVFLMSDPHYGHKNLTYGESVWSDKETSTRKFDTSKQMSDHIVQQINKYVQQDDILFCLGDWSFGGIQNIWNFRKQLVVEKIYLIPGNHDIHIKMNKILPNVFWDTKEIDYCELASDCLSDTQKPNSLNVFAKELFTEVYNYLEIIVDNTLVCLFHFPLEEWNDQHGKQQVIHLHGHSHGSCSIKPNRLDVGLDNAFKLYGEYRPFSWDDIKRELKV